MVSIIFGHAILDQYYVKTHKSQLHVISQVNYQFVGSSVGRFWNPRWLDPEKICRLLTLKWGTFSYILLPETLRKHDEAGKRGTAFCTESRGIAFVASAT